MVTETDDKINNNMQLVSLHSYKFLQIMLDAIRIISVSIVILCPTSSYWHTLRKHYADNVFEVEHLLNKNSLNLHFSIIIPMIFEMTEPNLNLYAFDEVINVT